jgi:hypothetical protein
MKTSTAGPLGVLSGAPAAATTVVDEDIDGGPPGVLPGALAVATIVVDEDVDAGPPGGAGAEGPGSPTINVKTSTTGPQEVPELKVWERPPSM